MKNLLLIAMLMMVETLTFAQDNYLFLLSYQKSTSFYGDRIATDDLPSITGKIEDLIKQEFYPTLIDTDWNIAWIYINNPSYYSNNYKLLIHNEYLESFNNLFPIKLTKKLKKLLHDWHHSKTFDTIGIKYEVEDGKITTIIDEKKFEHYLRTSKNLKIGLKSGQIFSYVRFFPIRFNTKHTTSSKLSIPFAQLCLLYSI